MIKGLNLIATIGIDNGISFNDKPLFSIEEDLERFDNLTDRELLVMSKTTYFKSRHQIDFTDNRYNLILSRDENFKPTFGNTVRTMEELISILKEYGCCYVIGGESLYKSTIDLAERLYLTQVFTSEEADTYFPSFSMVDWDTEQESELLTGINQHTDKSVNFKFLTLKRKLT